jgi:hypothetical protein
MDRTNVNWKLCFSVIVAIILSIYIFPLVSIAGDRLTAGQSISRGGQLTSPDGKHRLILQEDGNLVLYSGNKPTWYTNSAGIAIKELVMQNNGELILYRYDGKPAWSSHTSGDTNTFVALQNDGNLVIYDKGKPIWFSNTAGQ